MEQVLVLLTLTAAVCGLPDPQRDRPRDWLRDNSPQRWRWPDDDNRYWRHRHRDRPEWFSPYDSYGRPDWNRRPALYPNRVPPGFILGNVVGGPLSGAPGAGVARPAKLVPVASNPNSGSAQAVGIGTASVNNGAATATGVGIANAPNGGIGFGLGIGGAISTPFGSTAFGSGQSVAIGR